MVSTVKLDHAFYGIIYKLLNKKVIAIIMIAIIICIWFAKSDQSQLAVVFGGSGLYDVPSGGWGYLDCGRA